MRVQPDNVKSVNLVAELTHFVSVVYTRVTPQTIGICTELFNTLHEICEVCMEWWELCSTKM